MRACFLGQNVTALGFGVALLQTQPLHEPETPILADADHENRAEKTPVPAPEGHPAKKPQPA